jgi:hypothetical protein
MAMEERGWRPAILIVAGTVAAVVALLYLFIAVWSMLANPTVTSGGAHGWAVVEFPAAKGLDSITSVGGRLVITGEDANGAAAWISPDGVRWKAAVVRGNHGHESPDEVSMGVVSGHGDQLIALGGRLVTTGGTSAWESALWVSRDGGASWDDTPSGSLPKGTTHVAATANGYLALGFGPNGIPVLWASQDGVNWSEGAGESTFGNRYLQDLAVHDGHIVVVGYDMDQTSGASPARAWRSDDGVTWQSSAMSGESLGQPADVTATDSGFVAVGMVHGDLDGAVAWQSPDGLVWHQVPLKGGDRAQPVVVAASGERSVAVGDAGPGTPWWILTSSDPPISLKVDGYVQGIEAFGGRYIGIGATGCNYGLNGRCTKPVLIFALPPGTSPPELPGPS